MKTAAEYRAMADECFKWARKARADEVRVSLLQSGLMLPLNSTACLRPGQHQRQTNQAKARVRPIDGRRDSHSRRDKKVDS